MDGGAGQLSARERANGVNCGGAGGFSGLAIDRDEEALRGGGGRGGAEGEEEGYLVGAQSVPGCGPHRLPQSPAGSGIPKSSHFVWFGFFFPHGCKYHSRVIPVEKGSAQMTLRQARALTRAHIHPRAHLWRCCTHALCHRPRSQYGFSLDEQQLASLLIPMEERGGGQTQ